MVATRTPATHTSIDPGTEMGLLALTVADLGRSLTYYTEGIGLEELRRDDGIVTLGAGGKPLLVLIEQPGAAPWPRGGRSYTGLYHFALLLPTRPDLGRWLRNWFERGYPFPGMGDHLVSEALYLEDPDGHGIEMYADRPRSQWEYVDGQPRMGTGPVDIRGLLEAAARTNAPWTGLPAGTKLGHMHLQVGDIARARAFYSDILGFDIIAQMPSALFVSAGGYHHHIGMNTWHSGGAGPAPADSVNLRFFTIDLPSDQARQPVLDRLAAAGIEQTQAGDAVQARDPWGNVVVFQVSAASDVETVATMAGTAR